MSRTGEIEVLKDDGGKGKLRELAEIIWEQETDAIMQLQFKSSIERDKCLHDCKSNYQSIIHLLNSGLEMKSKFDKDAVRAPIADDIYLYIIYSVNSSLQTVRNYSLRVNFLGKISGHSKSLMDKLEKLDTENLSDIENLPKEASQSMTAVLKYLRNYRSGASANFSKWVKESGMSFDQLVERYKSKLQLGGQFKSLTDEKKLLVYNEIIKASGREHITVEDGTNSGTNSKAVLLFCASMMVWEIFRSGHLPEEAVQKAVVTAAQYGGAMLEDIVKAALSTEVLNGIEATELYVTMAGLVTGFIGFFVLGAIAGLVIDAIIDSGGSTKFSTDQNIFHVASMPDGEVLARQIAHGN